VGAPELLGGFTAGLALSLRFYRPFGAFLAGDSNFAHEIESQMNPIIRLFTVSVRRDRLSLDLVL
jgi:hypothetical protein